MATFINQSLSATSVSKDKFIFDDVNGYFVNATVGDMSQNTITFGNGNFDRVFANGDISKNTITFGDGVTDFVTAFGNISQNTITFGNGDSDQVFALGNISQ